MRASGSRPLLPQRLLHAHPCPEFAEAQFPIHERISKGSSDPASCQAYCRQPDRRARPGSSRTLPPKGTPRGLSRMWVMAPHPGIRLSTRRVVNLFARHPVLPLPGGARRTWPMEDDRSSLVHQGGRRSARSVPWRMTRMSSRLDGLSPAPELDGSTWLWQRGRPPVRLGR